MKSERPPDCRPHDGDLDAIKEGVANLVGRCAGVQSGESVLILNEAGQTDAQVADLMAQEVRAAGAECYALWAPSMDRGATVVPKVLLGALLAADKAI